MERSLVPGRGIIISCGTRRYRVSEDRCHESSRLGQACSAGPRTGTEGSGRKSNSHLLRKHCYFSNSCVPGTEPFPEVQPVFPSSSPEGTAWAFAANWNCRPKQRCTLPRGSSLSLGRSSDRSLGVAEPKWHVRPEGRFHRLYAATAVC